MDCSEKTDSVTGLLKSWNDGDPTALDKLLTIVYQEFRNMAGHMMANQRKNHTLQPTALVNEVYLRLLNVREQTFENRTEFYKYVAEIMRNILVSHARYKLAVKRGGNKPHIPVDLVELPWESPATPEELIEVDRMLKSFESKDQRMCHVVRLRYFLGCTENETADLLGVDRSTIQREWRTIKYLMSSWLQDPTETSSIR